MEDCRIARLKKADPTADGYWRVVKVDLEDGTEFKDENLFETRVDAEDYRKECQRKWQENAWDEEEYNSMDYQLRFVTQEEATEEKRKKRKEWQAYVRTSFYDPMVEDTFITCCQKNVADMKRRVENVSEKEISNMRHNEKQMYSSWQTYGGGAKVLTYMQPEPDCQEVSYWGMFLKDSMFGSIGVKIEKFDRIEDFKTWLEDISQATSVVNEKMKGALVRMLSDKD